MRFYLIIPILMSLMGCDSPSLKYRNAPEYQAQAGGMTFSIRVLPDGSAQAIRTSRHAWPRYDAVARAVRQATQQATGCRVVWGRGDPSVINLGLSCRGRPAPPRPDKKRAVIYFVSE